MAETGASFVIRQPSFVTPGVIRHPSFEPSSVAQPPLTTPGCQPPCGRRGAAGTGKRVAPGPTPRACPAGAGAPTRGWTTAIGGGFAPSFPSLRVVQPPCGASGRGARWLSESRRDPSRVTRSVAPSWGVGTGAAGLTESRRDQHAHKGLTSGWRGNGLLLSVSLSPCLL